MTMRINEIIDTEFTEKGRKREFDYDELKKQEYKSVEKAKEGEPGADQGWYSRGYQNPRDPHEFVKTTHLPSILQVDAYYLYIRMLAKLQKQGYHNPYFPVVYQVRVSRDPNGNERPRYRIENLQSPAAYSVEALYGIVEKILMRPDAVVKFRDLSEKTKHSLWADMANVLEDYIINDDFSNIKDKKLIKALQIINQIRETNTRFSPDIHGGNIMIRGTPYGPQLVLMDPISDGGQSIVGKHQIK